MTHRETGVALIIAGVALAVAALLIALWARLRFHTDARPAAAVACAMLTAIGIVLALWGAVLHG